MRIKNILYTICSVIAFSSCNYLDVEPTGKVIPETVTDYRALMTSAYSVFPEYKSLLAIRSDEVFPFNSDKDWSDVYNLYIDMATWVDNSPGSGRSYPWVSMYQSIFYANSIIAGVTTATENTTEDSREQLKAEALLLRAYAHFELLNLYAKPYNATTATSDRGVPIATKIDIEQRFIPSKVEEVYTQILSDIEESRALLQVKDQPARVRYRFSKKSAMALEARVRLYRSEWNMALQLAENLIPSCPLENLNDATAILPYDVTSKESILALEAITTYDIVAHMYVLPALINKYNLVEDARVSRYYSKKKDNYVPQKGNKDNMKVTFRSGEIYLIAAEAAAHVDGKLDIAKTRLKQLIENRLSPAYYATRVSAIDAMNQQQLLDEIADERGRELALEGHRWYDLRRTTRPAIVKTYFDQDKKEKTTTLSKDDARYTILFPKEAIQNNPDLQN